MVKDNSGGFIIVSYRKERRMSSSPPVSGTSPNRPVYGALDLVPTTQTLNFSPLTFGRAEDDPGYPGDMFTPALILLGPVGSV